MNEEWAFFVFLIALPLVICIFTAIRHFTRIRGHLASRIIPALFCLIPPLAIVNNATRVVNNNIETVLFYLAPALLLSSLGVGIVFRKTVEYSKADFILMTLSTLVSTWIALFVYASRQLP